MPTHIRLRGSSRKKGGFFKMFYAAVLTAALLAGGFAAFLLFEFEKPTLVLGKQLKYLGGSIELPLHATDKKSGISALTITLTQGETSAILLQRHFARKAWFST